MKPTPIILALLAAAVPLAGCSASSTPAPAVTSSVGRSATVSAGGSYPAAEVCTYLTGQLPTLEAVGSPVGAHANLVGNLFGFVQSHGIVPDSAALDEATTAQCPDVRQKVLAVTGLTSLTQL